MIAAVETALVARLAAALPELAVEAYAGPPEDYKLTHPRGALITRYEGSAFAPPKAPDAMIQPRTLRWRLTLLLRDLRAPRRAYEALEAVRLAVQNWGRAETGGAFRMLADAFEGAEHGVWRYSVTVSHTLVAVPAVEPIDGDPALLARVTRITAIDVPLGETVVVGEGA